MSYLFGMAQCAYPHDGNVLAQVRRCVIAAASAGVRLLAFPENLMCPHPLDPIELRDLAEPLDGPFATQMCDLARDNGLWLAFTMSEVNPSGGQPFNTAVVVGSHGDVQASYRKCHLYDAHGVHESDRMTAGDSLCPPIQTPFCTLGIGICYDLRFPEVARSLAVSGCNLVVFPAAWHDGPHKQDHWETLLKARAIENECFVAGVCHAGNGLVEDSMVVSPLGQPLPSTTIAVGHDTTDLLLVTQIDMQQVEETRSAMPILEHRRPELYHSLTHANEGQEAETSCPAR